MFIFRNIEPIKTQEENIQDLFDTLLISICLVNVSEPTDNIFILATIEDRLFILTFYYNAKIKKIELKKNNKVDKLLEHVKKRFNDKMTGRIFEEIINKALSLAENEYATNNKGDN